MKDFDAWLARLVSTIDAADGPLADEIRAVSGLRSLAAPGAVARSARAAGATTRAAIERSVRNIVLRVGRPVLAIVDGAAQLTFNDSESEVWRSRLQASSEQLRRAARAVGRINVVGIPDLPYAGTGWLVEQNTLLTNRHVAGEFARRSRGGFTFKPGIDDAPIRASIDFLEEAGRRKRLEYPIVEVLHIEDDDGPDFALLRVERGAGMAALAPPIPLSASPASPGLQVAVIGYPARDSRVPDAKLMQSIFGNVFDKKRLAPGQVTKAQRDVVLHDCSTLGGNSGSVVLDLATGSAVGLHFAGRFLETNYAVPAAVVAKRLAKILGHKPHSVPAGRPHHDSHPTHPVVPPPVAPDTLTGPEVMVEGVPHDYVGRPGYDPMFTGFSVPLPTIRNADDVLTFEFEGHTQSELKYQHFSVVMSRARRLCIFSAGNIDGSTPKRFKRPAWRLDPRIPTHQQIRDECYGNEPLFARGHMTRREDPVWGDAEAASLGNSDSMHVTNTVPQMQPFNAGIWLALESYALDHARSDQMRISVCTGPFLLADDPVVRGVRIPRSFWKVIAFVHDETRALCATGYTMSQEAFLRPDEFVFGRHQTAQVRIATIEQRAGLSFGPLTALDPFDGDEEGVETALTDPSQIRFIKRRSV
jgi:endonuclease G